MRLVLVRLTGEPSARGQLEMGLLSSPMFPRRPDFERFAEDGSTPQPGSAGR